MFIDFLLKSRAISRLYIPPTAGSHGLDSEYVSNIISNSRMPESISAHIVITNTLDSKTANQLHIYNNSMNKINSGQTASVKEIRRHIDAHELTKTIPLKSQNVYILASLHDAYVIRLNQNNWWENTHYKQYFMNDDNNEDLLLQLVTREPHLSLEEINRQINIIVHTFIAMGAGKFKNEQKKPTQENLAKSAVPPEKAQQEIYNKMLSTPFGMHYGKKIDSILFEIFYNNSDELSGEIKFFVLNASSDFKETNSISLNPETIIELCTWLITTRMDSQTFIENFLEKNSNKQLTTDFTNQLFKIFFELKFRDIFKIIKHPENISFACSFIIKRIYINYGEEIPEYGLFFINTVAQFEKNQHA
jgi:hypothetical protein